MAREAHFDKRSVCPAGEPLTDKVKKTQKVRKGSLPGLEKLNKVQEFDPCLHEVHLLVQLIAPVPRHLPLLEDTGPPDQLVPVEICQDQLEGQPVCLEIMKCVFDYILCLAYQCNRILYMETHLGQLQCGVAVKEGEDFLNQLRTLPKLLLRFTSHPL